MKISEIKTLVDGVGDVEEMKTNLCLAKVEWTAKKQGAGEIIYVRADEGRYILRKDGKLEKA